MALREKHHGERIEVGVRQREVVLYVFAQKPKPCLGDLLVIRMSTMLIRELLLDSTGHLVFHDQWTRTRDKNNPDECCRDQWSVSRSCIVAHVDIVLPCVQSSG